jgi:hypothetical protein
MDKENGDEWFVLEGSIAHFQWAAGHENLLAQVEARARQKSAAAGATAIALDAYGALARSSTVAMYDGEETENFVCVLNGKVIHGTFCGARKLKNGDNVKMVVSALENDVWHAHAIQRPSDKLIWLPSLAYCGNDAAKRSYFLLSAKVGMFCWASLFLVVAGIAAFSSDVTWKQVVLWAVVSAVVLPFLFWAVEFLPGRVGREFSEMASKIFELLEFPNPGYLNMQGADLESQADEPDTRNVYMYELALDALANGTRIKTKFERDIIKIAEENQRTEPRRKTARGGKAV